MAVRVQLVQGKLDMGTDDAEHMGGSGVRVIIPSREVPSTTILAVGVVSVVLVSAIIPPLIRSRVLLRWR